MSDYLIDFHTAIEAMNRISDCICEAEAVDALCELPTVELIRCMECKYNSNTEGNYVNCDIIPQMFGKKPDDNYCSWAERKQDEH